MQAHRSINKLQKKRNGEENKTRKLLHGKKMVVCYFTNTQKERKRGRYRDKEKCQQFKIFSITFDDKSER